MIELVLSHFRQETSPVGAGSHHFTQFVRLYITFLLDIANLDAVKPRGLYNTPFYGLNCCHIDIS